MALLVGALRRLDDCNRSMYGGSYMFDAHEYNYGGKMWNDTIHRRDHPSLNTFVALRESEQREAKLRGCKLEGEDMRWK